MTTIENWSDFCLLLASSDANYTRSIRKIVPDVMFQTTLDDSIRLTNVGFKPKGSKLTMLKKYYYNEQSIEKAKVALDKIRKKDDYGSVAFSTIGEEKKFTHHQHCIQSISIRHYPGGKLEYTVFYRAAEVIKIFTGDMVFMRDILMPIFGSGRCCFFFSNATLNAMYCPLMFIHSYYDWVSSLESLYKKDKAFFRRFKKWTEMYFSDQPINYSSAEVIRHHIHQNLSPKKRKKIWERFEAIENR